MLIYINQGINVKYFILQVLRNFYKKQIILGGFKSIS